MENVDMSEYEQAQQNYAGLAKNASTYNNFFSSILGFDATYGSYENLMASRMQNAFNSAEAAKNRNWQEYMSTTANQRAVEDLKQVGFSPLALLGNTSGASTPSGAAASSSSGTGGSSGSKSADLMKSIMSSIMLLGISSANNAAKKQLAATNNAAKKELANLTKSEVEDFIKTSNGFHRIRTRKG